jgi:pyruvate/2-oxoglutarate dehydrogenase complex dihydrolipoamide acyltransferase (E2) component
MPFTIVMPALESAPEIGKLVSWLKKEGDTAVRGQPSLKVETDKVPELDHGPAFLRGRRSGTRAALISAREQSIPTIQQATFTAIISPPQAAILAVGRIADRVVPVRPPTRRPTYDHA